MSNWMIDKIRADAPEGFPFAVIGQQERVIAWVANEVDARFIADAPRKISGLQSDSSRSRRLWLGSLGRGRS